MRVWDCLLLGCHKIVVDTFAWVAKELVLLHKKNRNIRLHRRDGTVLKYAARVRCLGKLFQCKGWLPWKNALQSGFGLATFAYVSAARKFIQNSSHGINNAQVLAMLEYEQLQVGKSNYSKKLRMEQQRAVNDIYDSCDAHNLRAENRMVHRVWLHKDAGVRKIREIDF